MLANHIHTNTLQRQCSISTVYQVTVVRKDNMTVPVITLQRSTVSLCSALTSDNSQTLLDKCYHITSSSCQIPPSTFLKAKLVLVWMPMKPIVHVWQTGAWKQARLPSLSSPGMSACFAELGLKVTLSKICWQRWDQFVLGYCIRTFCPDNSSLQVREANRFLHQLSERWIYRVGFL